MLTPPLLRVYERSTVRLPNDLQTDERRVDDDPRSRDDLELVSLAFFSVTTMLIRALS